MNQSIERTALSNLITNEDYARKVIPFLKSDYFKVREERIEESIFSATTTSSPGTSNAVQSKSKSVNHLQKIVKRKREDDVSSVPAKTSNSIGVVVKKTSTPVKTSPIKLSLCSTDYGNSSSSDENE